MYTTTCSTIPLNTSHIRNTPADTHSLTTSRHLFLTPTRYPVMYLVQTASTAAYSCTITTVTMADDVHNDLVMCNEHYFP